MDPYYPALNFYEFNDPIVSYLSSFPVQNSNGVGSSSLELLNSPISTSSKTVGNPDINGKIDHHPSSTDRRNMSAKGDRHSKIPTANGLRDRRMRLNLDVAKDFFDLMDLLGFDKASKAVKWLLMKAKPAIDELKGFPSSSSPTSECEIMTQSTADHGDAIPTKMRKKKNSQGSLPKGKNVKKIRRNALNPLSKDMRKRARERARERTHVKRTQMFDDNASTDFEQVTVERPYEYGEESGSQTPSIKSSIDVLSLTEVLQDQSKNYASGKLQECTSSTMAVTPNWSPLPFSAYSQDGSTYQSNPEASWEAYNYPFAHLSHCR